MFNNIQKYLGESADYLLNHKAIFPKEQLHLPGTGIGPCSISSHHFGSHHFGDIGRF